MGDRPTTLREAASRLVAQARDANVSLTAAGIAYYAQVSLLPSLLLGFVVLSVVAGDRVATEVLAATGDALSPAGRRLLRDRLTDVTGRTEVGLAGLVVLLWGSFRLFRGLASAVAEVYGDSEGVVVRWRDSLVAAVAVLVGVSVVVGAGLAFARFGPVPGAVRALFLTVALSVTLAPVYYVLPPDDVALREAVPGTVLTAGGWVVLRVAFRAYLDLSNRYAVFGVLGALVLLVTWLYVASLLLVLGAVLNAVLSGSDHE